MRAIRVRREGGLERRKKGKEGENDVRGKERRGDGVAPPAQMVLPLQRGERKPPLCISPPVKHLVGALCHIQPQTYVVFLLGRPMRQFGLVGRLVVHNHDLVLVQFLDEALWLVLSHLLLRARSERSETFSRCVVVSLCAHP
jgi:hypothetical protein